MIKLLTACFALTSASLTPANQKPNILFLIADDMPWKAIAALSGEYIDTPNLDRLAARGTSFDQTFNSGKSHRQTPVPQVAGTPTQNARPARSDNHCPATGGRGMN